VNKGILYIILSGLSFVVVNFFVKVMGTGPEQQLFPGMQKFPAHELVLARSIISFLLSYLVIRSKGLNLLGNNKKWLMIRGVAGMTALTIFFYTIHYLPLAIASTVQYLAPVFTVIFAMILLKEEIKKLQWFFIAVAFTGVGMISFNNYLSGSFGTIKIDYFWLGMGILSAAFSGIAYTAIVKLKATDTPINIVIYFPMLSIPFQYLGAIYASLLGYFVFFEKLSWVVYAGIALILIGVIVNALLKRR